MKKLLSILLALVLAVGVFAVGAGALTSDQAIHILGASLTLQKTMREKLTAVLFSSIGSMFNIAAFNGSFVNLEWDADDWGTDWDVDVDSFSPTAYALIKSGKTYEAYFSASKALNDTLEERLAAAELAVFEAHGIDPNTVNVGAFIDAFIAPAYDDNGTLIDSGLLVDLVGELLGMQLKLEAYLAYYKSLDVLVEEYFKSEALDYFRESYCARLLEMALKAPLETIFDAWEDFAASEYYDPYYEAAGLIGKASYNLEKSALDIVQTLTVGYGPEEAQAIWEATNKYEINWDAVKWEEAAALVRAANEIYREMLASLGVIDPTIPTYDPGTNPGTDPGTDPGTEHEDKIFGFFASFLPESIANMMTWIVRYILFGWLWGPWL